MLEDRRHVFASRCSGGGSHCTRRGIAPTLSVARLAWLILWLVLLLPFGSAWASDPWAPFDLPWFDRIGVAEGLPHSVSTAVAQDRRGLIWIGTMGGLVRYDGYRMREFGDAAGPSPDLPDAYVRSLLAVPDGGMLVGTNSGGLGPAAAGPRKGIARSAA